MAKQPNWTPAECEAIAQLFPVHGGTIVWPWRSRDALTQQANRMGYRSGINRVNNPRQKARDDAREMRAMREWRGAEPGQPAWRVV